MSAAARALASLREGLRALSTRDRRALLLGLAVLVPAFGWVGIARPWWNEVRELRETTAAERALLERERALLREAPTFPERLAEVELALRRKESRLLNYTNLALAEAAIAGQVEESAGESRALLLDVRSLDAGSDDAPTAELSPIRLGIRAESDFQGLLTFLNSLEAHPLLIRLIAFSIQPEDETGVMTIDAILEAYSPGATPERDGIQDG